MGGGGKGESVVQSACQYDVTFRVSNFENGEESVHQEERIKISILSRRYCSIFLDLEILKFLLS